MLVIEMDNNNLNQSNNSVEPVNPSPLPNQVNQVPTQPSSTSPQPVTPSVNNPNSAPTPNQAPATQLASPVQDITPAPNPVIDSAQYSVPDPQFGGREAQPKKSNLVLIIGIVIGALIIVGAVVGVILYQKNSSHKVTTTVNGKQVSGSVSVTPEQFDADFKACQPVTDNLSISSGQQATVTIIKKSGSGCQTKIAFGSGFSNTYNGTEIDFSNTSLTCDLDNTLTIANALESAVLDTVKYNCSGSFVDKLNSYLSQNSDTINSSTSSTSSY